MKVVRLINRLNVGGPAIHAVLLTRGLSGPRFTSLLVTGIVEREEGSMLDYAREHGVEPVVLPELQRSIAPWRDLRAFLKILRILWIEQPDLIHTHTAKAGGLGRLAGVVYNVLRRASGAPRARIVHTFHGHIFHGYFPAWKSRLLVVAERLLAYVTDCVVTVSDELRQELSHRYRICSPSRIAVVPVGLDLGWTDRLGGQCGALRRKYGVPRDALAIGIVGRLTGVKNHELFLQAASACRLPMARFFVIGDGERRRELWSLAERLGLDGRVVFTGWVWDPAMVYADLNIGCLTSVNEGTPVALIEAMAAGLPIIATRVGGVTNLMVGSASARDGLEIFANGVLLPPNRADLLTAAIEFLAARPDLRREMGRAGQAFVRDRFSAERLVAQMERLYAAVVEGAWAGDINGVDKEAGVGHDRGLPWERRCGR